MTTTPTGAGEHGRGGTRLDTLGMWEATLGLPEQLEAAAEQLAQGIGPLGPGGAGRGGGARQAEFHHVVAVGMGGSGIAGDVVAAVAGPRCPVPVAVVKSYDLPAFVGPRSLVIALSFSGDTEEVLTAATAAWDAGATVVSVTRGGRLGQLAASHGSPVLAVPTTIPQPRAALGALAVPALAVLAEAGLLDGVPAMVAAAVTQLRRRRDGCGGPSDGARGVAATIGRTLPLIHGSDGVAAVAAQRWRTQVNENAKSPAFSSVQPELCHNEIAGWGQHGDVTRQLLTVVMLRHPAERPQVARRFEIVSEILREVVADVVTVQAEGEGPLAHLFDLVFMGDLVSLYLADAEGLDPGPVPVLEELKAALRS